MLKRNTAVLLALAIGLALVVLVLNQVDQQQQEQRQQESRLFTFAPEEVEQIRIETLPEEEDNEDPQVIQLIRETDTWQLQEPISSPADVFTVDSLLQTASDLQPAEDLEQTGQESDLEPFGLDPAQETLSFTLSGGETQTLTLGNLDFDGTGIYALSDEDQLLTIPRSAQGRLSPNLFALREKTLLTLQRDQIQTLEIQKATAEAPDVERIQLTQTDSGWQIQAPRVLQVDQAAVDRLVNPLLSLQASGFAAENQTDLESYGLDQPQTELIITLAPSEPQAEEEETEMTEEPIRIALGSTDDTGSGVYVLTSTTTTVATLPLSTVQGLQPTLSQLRDKQMAQIDPEQVIEVTIEAQEADLSRSLLPSTATPAPSPTPEEETEASEAVEDLAGLDSISTEEPAEDLGRLWEISDQDRVVNLDPLFTALNQGRARTFLSPQDPRAEQALSDPLFSLRFDLEDEEEDLLFRFAEDEDQIYAEVPGRRDILILERTALNSIRSALEDLKPE